MNNTELVLSIYTRAECHLCEEMLDDLKSWQNQFKFKINIVNIEHDASLTDRYATRIPVLTAGDIEICNYHLDENTLLKYFKSAEQ